MHISEIEICIRIKQHNNHFVCKCLRLTTIDGYRVMGANQSTTENPQPLNTTTSHEKLGTIDPEKLAAAKKKTGDDSEAPTKFEKVEAKMQPATNKKRRRRPRRKSTGGLATPSKDQTVSRDETKSVDETTDSKEQLATKVAANMPIKGATEPNNSKENMKSIIVAKKPLKSNGQEEVPTKSWYDWAFGK
ncbi:hypothetical protein M3Y98_00453700 [Aphelenchoides besseyi]|nr:hypothetical protein M3Y98_00453700 [Aphelenchoides besseyi]KAI6207418.1 hypothetical protein M3Y96_00007000 [Aphelenchoides besseyi]